MNARSQTFELELDDRQVNEAVSSIFHTLLFHRTTGKFTYNADQAYSVGAIGYTEVPCQYIDLTYICCTSPKLNDVVSKEIENFSQLLSVNETKTTGQISLEFYQKKRPRWSFRTECIPWEVWSMKLKLTKSQSEDEKQNLREKLGDTLAKKIMYINEFMMSDHYLPSTPNQSDLELIFDSSYPDIQPYLFRLYYSHPSLPSSTMGDTVKKLMRETIAL